MLTATPADAEWLHDSRPMMGTEVSVHLWSEDAALGQETIDAVFSEAARIDRLMSTYRDASEISALNRCAHQREIAVSDELFGLLRRSVEISELTAGAFDITYESVGQHYDFRQRERPDDATIAIERQRIDYRYLLLDGDKKTVRFKVAGVRINLGGIAKGHVVERGAEILRRAGIENGVVTAGGDSRLLGDRRGQPWMVGVRDPRRDGEVAIRVPLVDEAISTSGDYERFFEENGIRYHHILHPQSGVPAGGVHSATVIGPDAVTTDALSTSVFVLGVDRGLRLIASLPDYESIVIDADGKVWFSDGLQPPD